MNNIVWQSTITDELVKHLDQETIDELIEELNDAVVRVAQDYDLE